jgi:hypothetical protein
MTSTSRGVNGCNACIKPSHTRVRTSNDAVCLDDEADAALDPSAAASAACAVAVFGKRKEARATTKTRSVSMVPRLCVLRAQSSGALQTMPLLLQLHSSKPTAPLRSTSTEEPTTCLQVNRAGVALVLQLSQFGTLSSSLSITTRLSHLRCCASGSTSHLSAVLQQRNLIPRRRIAETGPAAQMSNPWKCVLLVPRDRLSYMTVTL